MNKLQEQKLRRIIQAEIKNVLKESSSKLITEGSDNIIPDGYYKVLTRIEFHDNFKLTTFIFNKGDLVKISTPNRLYRYSVKHDDWVSTTIIPSKGGTNEGQYFIKNTKRLPLDTRLIQKEKDALRKARGFTK